MPYIRKKNCIYLKTTGKKVGCSSSPEKAKRYIKALHANVKENISFANLYRLLIKKIPNK